jgi:hypothetical protein
LLSFWFNLYTILTSSYVSLLFHLNEKRIPNICHSREKRMQRMNQPNSLQLFVINNNIWSISRNCHLSYYITIFRHLYRRFFETGKSYTFSTTCTISYLMPSCITLIRNVFSIISSLNNPIHQLWNYWFLQRVWISRSLVGGQLITYSFFSWWGCQSCGLTFEEDDEKCLSSSEGWHAKNDMIILSKAVYYSNHLINVSLCNFKLHQAYMVT